jgi:CRP-like cAMP-binding protein
VVTYDARRTIIPAETQLAASLYLVEGFMCRYLDDRRGNRQLVSMQIPGDFVDLHGYPLRSLDHDVGTLSPVEVAIFQHADLEAVFARRPELTRKLWFSTLLDAALHREWIFKLGRLPSHGRVAHLLCETNARLTAVGLSDGRRFELPLTQLDLGEMCGMTSIHVNRVIRDLRERGLCTFRGGVVELHDAEELARIGEFQPAYLYLAPEVTPPGAD